MSNRRGIATVCGALVTLGAGAGLLICLTSCTASPRIVSTAATPAAVSPDAAVAPSPKPPTVAVPDGPEARRLAAAAFFRLAEAIERKDFNGLYAAMAPAFRSSIPLQRVADEFRPFTDNNIDLTRANPKLLVLTPAPHLDAKGVLILRGFVPTPQQTWYFGFGYLADEPGWALIQVALSSRPE